MLHYQNLNLSHPIMQNTTEKMHFFFFLPYIECVQIYVTQYQYVFWYKQDKLLTEIIKACTQALVLRYSHLLQKSI